MRHRVVVTGMGSLSPLGDSSEQLWDGLMKGRSGIGEISLFDTTDYPVTIAGEVKDFEPARWIEPKEVKKLDRFLQLSIAAAIMAVEDAGLEVNESNANDVGVYIGSGIGGAGSLCEGSALLSDRGPKRVSPFLIPRILITLASGHVSIAPCGAAALQAQVTLPTAQAVAEERVMEATAARDKAEGRRAVAFRAREEADAAREEAEVKLE